MDEPRKQAIRDGVIQALKEKGIYTGATLPKICLNCKVEYTPHRSTQKHCSRACGVKHKTAQSILRGKSEAVTKFRRNVKLRAIEFLGGKCKICGYCNCPAALEFHHLDPSQKDFSIGGNGVTRSWKKMEVELRKCVLLCANCHREVHAGITEISNTHFEV